MTSNTLIELDSSFCAGFLIPPVLYHGAWQEAADAILEEGMNHHAGAPQSMASYGGNYLTTSLAMAASIARSRAARHGSTPVVIAVDARALDPDNLAFDLNMSGRYWSESLVYHKPIPATAVWRDLTPIASIAEELMLLDEPTPGERPVAIDRAWEKAVEFLPNRCATNKIPASKRPGIARP